MKNWKDEKDTIYTIITVLRDLSHQFNGQGDVCFKADQQKYMKSVLNGTANYMESMIRDLLDVIEYGDRQHNKED